MLLVVLVTAAAAVVACACAGKVLIDSSRFFGGDPRIESVVWMDDGWIYAIERRSSDNSPLVRFMPGSDPELVELVLPLHPQGGLAGLLDRREEQPEQDRDDRDHHQQLEQRERRIPPDNWTGHVGQLPRGWGD